MPVACETDVLAGLCTFVSIPSPSAAAAWAVPSAVKEADACWRASRAECDLLRGEGIGEAIGASLPKMKFLGMWEDGACWRADGRGEGVLFAARWDERRADLRGAKGSQLS